MSTDLKKHYDEKVVPAMIKHFGYKNVHQVPKLVSVGLNMGLGDAINDKGIITKAEAEMQIIAGQKPQVTLSRRSEAGFKIRAGWPIGVKITLRREKMFQFLERMIHYSLPRVRDFQGLNARSFDRKGNYNFGFKEQIVFLGIKYDLVDKIRGLDVAVVTTANTDEEALMLLKLMKFPFRGE